MISLKPEIVLVSTKYILQVVDFIGCKNGTTDERLLTNAGCGVWRRNA